MTRPLRGLAQLAGVVALLAGGLWSATPNPAALRPMQPPDLVAELAVLCTLAAQSATTEAEWGRAYACMEDAARAGRSMS